MAKKYDQKYIADVTERIGNVLDDKREYSDWSNYKGATHTSSLDAVKSVIRTFKQKGYLVKNMFTFAHFNQVTILK